MSYPQFFQAATDNPPYDYQCRVATGQAGAKEQAGTDQREEWRLEGWGRVCRPVWRSAWGDSIL